MSKIDIDVVESIQDKYELLLPYLNEKTRRIWAAIEARALGWGGITQVAQATGLSRTTIHTGMRELGEASQTDVGKQNTSFIRQTGGGRKLVEEQDYTKSDGHCGGTNGYRTLLKWKLKLLELADETGLTFHVCHFPPGTSKWNKIEHRLFCHITQNWRGRPLTSLQVLINLIRNTTTAQGKDVSARLDKNQDKTGIKVTNEQFNAQAIERQSFHGEWNYQIKPRIAA